MYLESNGASTVSISLPLLGYMYIRPNNLDESGQYGSHQGYNIMKQGRECRTCLYVVLNVYGESRTWNAN